MDTRTERLIQQALETLLAGRTSFVIAHRLSTVRHADQVLVGGGGRMGGGGTQELLDRRGGPTTTSTCASSCAPRTAPRTALCPRPRAPTGGPRVAPAPGVPYTCAP